MVFSYQKKLIIKQLWIKYKYGTTRIVNDHPEYDWNVNVVKKFLKTIDETGDVAWKRGFEQLVYKSVHTEENIEQVEEIILSQDDHPGTHSTPADIACEPLIEHQSMSRIIDQDL